MRKTVALKLVLSSLLLGTLSTPAAIADEVNRVPNPPGVLNATTDMTISGSSLEFSVTTSQPEFRTEDGEIIIYDGGIARTLEGGDPYVLWDNVWVPAQEIDYNFWVPEHSYEINGNSDCYIDWGRHAYAAITVTVSESAEYTFRYVDSVNPLQGNDDPFLALYEGSFNRNQIDTDVVGCNDDRGDEGDYGRSRSGQYLDYLYPEFSAELSAGETYTLVLATYSFNPSSSIEDPYIGTFEFWGPAGSIDRKSVV